MKQKILVFTSIILFQSFIATLLTTAIIPASCENPSTISQNNLLPRPFGSHIARELLMIKTMHNIESPRHERLGTLSCTAEYIQNFGQSCNYPCKNLSARPFWSGTNVMTYGSNNGLSDIDAYQIGMGDIQGQGSIELNTKIMQIGGDILLHFTQDIKGRGAFFKIRAPIGVMRITHIVKENTVISDLVKNQLTNKVWLSYPSETNRYSNAKEFFQGGCVKTFQDGGTISGACLKSSHHKSLALENGRLSDCPQSTVRLGDISISIGYNVYGTKNEYVVIGLKVTTPTGNVPTGKYIQEPIFGNGGYWSIGFETTGHWKLWHNDDDTRGIDLWVQGEASHAHSGRKPNFRSFDLLANGKGSKYLITQFYFPSNPTTGTNPNPTGRIPSFLTHAINITTLPVISNINAQGDITFMIDAIWDNWNIALGLELWGRTKETLLIDYCNLIRTNSVNLNDFAVVGRQISEDISGSIIVPLHLCEPNAQINKSEDRILSFPITNTKIKDARLFENRIPANFSDALDIKGAAINALTSIKIFGQVSHTWKELDYAPNVSIIFSSEISPSKNNYINFWSIGTQGSINF